MTKLRRSRIKTFYIRNKKEISKAEDYQSSLYAKYDNVNVRIVGVDKVAIYGDSE